MLAEEASETIGLEVAYLRGNAKVLVVDFVPLHSGPPEMGTALADLFSGYFRKDMRGFAVFDREEYLKSMGTAACR